MCLTTNNSQTLWKVHHREGLLALKEQTSPYTGKEKCLEKYAETLPGCKRNNKRALSLIRYADDFVILHKDIKVVLQAKTVIQEWLNQIGLELKPEKTKIAHTLEEYEVNKPGFDFLGFNIRQYEVKSTKQGFKTLIKPSSKNIKTHYQKLADICGSNKTTPTRALLAKLNPVIIGWANYFSNQVSSRTFDKLDDLLWRRLGRWAIRRHPNKSAKWVKKKYFPRCKVTRNWLLNDGKYILKQHSDVPITRYVKVKGNKSHYDGDWTYWSNRIGKHPGVRKEVTTLLKRQKNKCAYCGLTFRSNDQMGSRPYKTKV